MSDTINKFPQKNQFDVEIAKIENENKKIDLEIEKEKSKSKFKSDMISALAKIISVIGSVFTGILAWKGECKVNVPESIMWSVLIVVLVILVVVVLLLLITWRIERNGKKRAIKEKQKYQKLAESSDLYRSSSCLTEQGDTPKERK